MDNEKILNGRYRLIAQHGSGGMAVIYRATDLALGRTVAIKVLRPSLTNDESFLVRFRQEARNVANLTHPNIMTVHDFGQEGNTYYIVMEFLDGQDLKKLIRSSAPLPIERALNLAIQICAGVGYAHRAGLVHADVKPQNILILDSDKIIVTDFGIAQALAATNLPKRQNIVWGSPHYFSPEQALGEYPTPASDVYSIGVVIFEMLTGRLPFIGADQQALAIAHIRDTPPRISELNPQVPTSLDRIIEKTLAKEPSARYRTADQLGRILMAYKEQSGETGLPPLPPQTRVIHQLPSILGNTSTDTEEQTESKTERATPSPKRWVWSGRNRPIPSTENISVSKPQPFSQSGSINPQKELVPTAPATSLENRSDGSLPKIHKGFEKIIHDVFISYSRKDSDLMMQLSASLEAQGLKVWVDKNQLQPGTASWVRAIQYAIDSCKCVVVILSPSAKDSEWVLKELSYSETQKKTIYPILARGHEQNAVPLVLTNSQWVDIREDRVYEEQISGLIAAIRQELGISSSIEKASSLQYRLYYQDSILPSHWFPIRLYLFEAPAVEKIESDAKTFLDSSHDIGQNPRLVQLRTEGLSTEVTISALHGEGVLINPCRVVLNVHENWHRVDFELALDPASVENMGKFIVTVAGVDITSFAISIRNSSAFEEDLSSTKNVTRTFLQSVYPSYSLEDRWIVSRLSQVYDKLNTNYLTDFTTMRMALDASSLRGVQEKIKGADLFQLFWSHAASKSPEVRREWNYALELIDQGIKDENFIRPVYWEQPMPQIPQELAHLHFMFQPELNSFT